MPEWMTRYDPFDMPKRSDIVIVALRCGLYNKGCAGDFSWNDSGGDAAITHWCLATKEREQHFLSVNSQKCRWV